MRPFLASLSRRQRVAAVVVAVIVVVLAAGGLRVLLFFQQDEPETFVDAVGHFKYGSIGSEAAGGIPYWVWRVLPTVFAEHLPDRRGEGYERFGFIYESEDHERPIGTSYREKPFPLLGLNCAVCHTGTVRTAPDAERLLVLGMPAQQLDFLGYQRFLIAAAEDERFNADTLIPAIERINGDFGWLDSLVYRYLIIPRLKDAILERAEEFRFLNDRPEWGPGRVDTFSPYKVHFGFDMSADDTIGTADLPPLFNQAVREGMWLHWDGNNDSLAERNLSAALGAGATEESLDETGRVVYERECAACHAFGAERVGQVEPLLTLGTDPERMGAFSPELAEQMNTFGTGEAWQFSRFRSTDGYANMPLDGVWLRAPYLHNGSVPTLRDLLLPPEERPTAFYRGYDVYDLEALGFVSAGPEAEREGFRFETSQRGNGNQGHVYGAGLSEQEVDALLEYLKTQ
jgi:hypothetical protein